MAPESAEEIVGHEDEHGTKRATRYTAANRLTRGLLAFTDSSAARNQKQKGDHHLKCRARQKPRGCKHVRQRHRRQRRI